MRKITNVKLKSFSFLCFHGKESDVIFVGENLTTLFVTLDNDNNAWLNYVVSPFFLNAILYNINCVE